MSSVKSQKFVHQGIQAKYGERKENQEKKNTDSWEMLPPISIGRECISLTSINQTIYAFGGVKHNPKQYFNLIERLDL